MVVNRKALLELEEQFISEDITYHEHQWRKLNRFRLEPSVRNKKY